MFGIANHATQRKLQRAPSYQIFGALDWPASQIERPTLSPLPTSHKLRYHRRRTPGFPLTGTEPLRYDQSGPAVEGWGGSQQISESKIAPLPHCQSLLIFCPGGGRRRPARILFWRGGGRKCGGRAKNFAPIPVPFWGRIPAQFPGPDSGPLNCF